MSEINFGNIEDVIGFDDYINKRLAEKQKIIDEQHKIIEQGKRYASGLEFRIVKLEKENKQLKEQVKRLQDIGTRTEAEKEKYADLYCKCENELIKNGRRCDGVKDE